MNLNTITKTQLRDFVDSKISKRKQALRKEIDEIVIAKMGIALNDVLGDVTELEKVSNRFEDLLNEKIEILGFSNVPEYAKTTAGQANKLCKAHKYFFDYILPKAMETLLNPNQSEYYRFKCLPLTTAFNELNNELQSRIKLYREGLDTLKRELNNAISIESKGKQAYNSLIALGVDLSDLPDVNPNLPAVTKLSVDVCILNGNCA